MPASMPTSVTPRRPQPEDVQLRDLLAQEPGWRAAAGERSELEVAGRRFLVSPLASCYPTVALLCEPLGGTTLPAYSVRRRVGARVRQLFPRPLTIFTDAAYQAQVWTWRSRAPGGPVAYRETTRPAEQPRPEWLRCLRSIVRDLEDAERVTPEGPDQGSVRDAVLRALLRRVRSLEPAAFGSRALLADTLREPVAPADSRALGQRVQDAIEETGNPELLRAFWRGLTGLSVLDPSCGSGDWLLSVLEALEPVYEACLERMASWVDDADRARSGRGRLSDFRAVLERAGDCRQHPTRRHFVRESIVLRNLFGAERDAAALAAAEMRFLLRVRAAAEFPVEPHPSSTLMCNLRQGDPETGFRSLRELQSAVHGSVDPGHLRALVEEMETLDRAEHRFRSLRLDHGAAAVDLLTGRQGVRLRREALNRQIDRLLAARHGVDPGDPVSIAAWRAAIQPLHRCVEYFGILRRGGFSLERGGEP